MAGSISCIDIITNFFDTVKCSGKDIPPGAHDLSQPGRIHFDAGVVPRITPVEVDACVP
jgi:hypothetical protein